MNAHAGNRIITAITTNSFNFREKGGLITEEKNLHANHRERMRQRLLTYGADQFQEHEILEMLLFYSIPRGDTNGTAHRLINTFGNLYGVLNATPNALKKVPGVGEQTATLIKLIAPICKRYLDANIERKPYTKAMIGEYLVAQYVGERNEVVYAFALDSGNHFLGCRRISDGVVNASQIHMRRILEFAMDVNAVSIVLAHNHPGGTALPSGKDLRTTEYIKNFLQNAGITLLDHLIIANDDYVSLKDSGCLAFEPVEMKIK